MPTTTPLSTAARDALADACRGPLYRFRRGFALNNLGPFHAGGTMVHLSRRRLVEARRSGGVYQVTGSGQKLAIGLARAALATGGVPA